MSIEETIHRLRGKAMTSGHTGDDSFMYRQLVQDVELSTNLILSDVKVLSNDREKLCNIAQKAIDLLDDNFDAITLQGELDKESISSKESP